MKWILSVAATMLIAGAVHAGCHVQQVVAAPLVTYQQVIQPVFQPVVAQYPVYAPVIQQQVAYPVQQRVIQQQVAYPQQAIIQKQFIKQPVQRQFIKTTDRRGLFGKRVQTQRIVTR